MYVGSYAICVLNWNWWLTQDHFLIKHWNQRTHRCSARVVGLEEYSLVLVSRYSTVRSGTLTWREWGLCTGVCNNFPRGTHVFASQMTHMGPTWNPCVFAICIAHVFCQTLALHGLHIVGPWNCPCITTVLPQIGITCASHLLAHEIAHVKPLFCHSLVLSWAYIGRPMKLPI